MAKVCEMIANRDYIRENNAGHPLDAPHTARVTSPSRARTGVVRAGGERACSRSRAPASVCVYAGAMLSRTYVEKSGRANGRGHGRT